MRNNKCAYSGASLLVSRAQLDGRVVAAATHAPRRDNCSVRGLTPAICKGKYRIKDQASISAQSLAGNNTPRASWPAVTYDLRPFCLSPSIYLSLSCSFSFSLRHRRIRKHGRKYIDQTAAVSTRSDLETARRRLRRLDESPAIIRVLPARLMGSRVGHLIATLDSPLDSVFVASRCTKRLNLMAITSRRLATEPFP